MTVCIQQIYFTRTSFPCLTSHKHLYWALLNVPNLKTTNQHNGLTLSTRCITNRGSWISTLFKGINEKCWRIQGFLLRLWNTAKSDKELTYRMTWSVTCSGGSCWRVWIGWRSLGLSCGWFPHCLRPKVSPRPDSPPQRPATAERRRAAGGSHLWSDTAFKVFSLR